MRLKLQSLKTMILGLMFMILGGTIVIDPASGLGGVEYLMMVVGLMMGIVGFWRED